MSRPLKIIPAIFEGIRTLKDRTLKLTFETNELPAEEAGYLMSSVHNEVKLAIQESEYTKEQEQEIIDTKGGKVNGYTPSQRLRHVLYRNWEQNDNGYPDFESYYEHKMERMIAYYKSKLD